MESTEWGNGVVNDVENVNIETSEPTVSVDSEENGKGVLDTVEKLKLRQQ